MGFGIQQTLVQVLALLFNASVTLSETASLLFSFLRGTLHPHRVVVKSK